jgi:hypothetical protein
MANAMGQGNKRASIWVTAALPLVFALNAANANDLAERPVDSETKTTLALDTAFKPASTEIAIEDYIDKAATATLAPAGKDEKDLKSAMKEKFAHQLLSRFNLHNWEYDKEFKGVDYNFSRVDLNNDFISKGELRWQFYFAIDGNGDPDPLNSMGNLFHNDRPATGGLSFKVIF